jgi:DNA-directed RNA polymerase subunit RPC12/RpoP
MKFENDKNYAYWLGYDQKSFTGKYKCPKCGKEYTYKEAEGKEKNKTGHACPHCGIELN